MKIKIKDLTFDLSDLAKIPENITFDSSFNFKKNLSNITRTRSIVLTRQSIWDIQQEYNI